MVAPQPTLAPQGRRAKVRAWAEARILLQAPHVDRGPLEGLAVGLRHPSVVRRPLMVLPPVARGPLVVPLLLLSELPWDQRQEGAASHECKATQDELLQWLVA